MRQVDANPDATLGVEGFKGLATVLALECCLSHFCKHDLFLLSFLFLPEGRIVTVGEGFDKGMHAFLAACSLGTKEGGLGHATGVSAGG